jgi:hypothetical protein
MRKRSLKMSRETMKYLNLRRKFMNEHPNCEARVAERCSLSATDVHHTKGRGRHFLNVLSWLAVCRSCHNWIETHPKDARELGFSDTKH